MLQKMSHNGAKEVAPPATLCCKRLQSKNADIAVLRCKRGRRDRRVTFSSVDCGDLLGCCGLPTLDKVISHDREHAVEEHHRMRPMIAAQRVLLAQCAHSRTKFLILHRLQFHRRWIRVLVMHQIDSLATRRQSGMGQNTTACEQSAHNRGPPSTSTSTRSLSPSLPTPATWRGVSRSLHHRHRRSPQPIQLLRRTASRAPSRNCASC
jgi:hypothetical protein